MVVNVEGCLLPRISRWVISTRFNIVSASGYFPCELKTNARFPMMVNVYGCSRPVFLRDRESVLNIFSGLLYFFRNRSVPSLAH